MVQMKKHKVFCSDSQNYRYSPGTTLPGASNNTGMIILTTILYDKELKILMHT